MSLACGWTCSEYRDRQGLGVVWEGQENGGALSELSEGKDEAKINLPLGSLHLHLQLDSTLYD